MRQYEGGKREKVLQFSAYQSETMSFQLMAYILRMEKYVADFRLAGNFTHNYLLVEVDTTALVPSLYFGIQFHNILSARNF